LEVELGESFDEKDVCELRSRVEPERPDILFELFFRGERDVGEGSAVKFRRHADDSNVGIRKLRSLLEEG